MDGGQITTPQAPRLGDTHEVPLHRTYAIYAYSALSQRWLFASLEKLEPTEAEKRNP